MNDNPSPATRDNDVFTVALTHAITGVPHPVGGDETMRYRVNRLLHAIDHPEEQEPTC